MEYSSKIMIYAPIIIPTLNRNKHLERCIVSLQKNSWAKYTDLIISVDYPPTDKYVPGHRKVCKYLEKGINGFLNVEIIYHEKNLGAYENYQFLKRHVSTKYDRYIFSEDDNEMSPNFIEYIDKGLELFENNENIIAVCSTGAGGEKETDDENVVLTHNYSAHGYGTWFKKDDKFTEQINRAYFEDISRNIKKLWQLYKYDPSLIFACQSAIFRKEKLYQLPDGSIPIVDMTIKIYAVLEDKYVVCPCIRKSRNWGYDGSGVNCLGKETYQPKVQIDTRKEFIYQYKETIRESKLPPKRGILIRCRVILAFLKLYIWKYMMCKK